MVSRTLTIIWSKRASISFKDIYNRIKSDSVVNAQKVRAEISNIIDGLIHHPEKYPPDKFKKKNPGHFRAFEKYSLRISYSHTTTEIRILRIRHVKQEPKQY